MRKVNCCVAVHYLVVFIELLIVQQCTVLCIVCQINSSIKTNVHVHVHILSLYMTLYVRMLVLVSNSDNMYKDT